MTGHGAKFGRKKEEAIAALLTERNLEEAARKVNVSTSTLLRWQKDPEFQSAYHEARRAAFGQSTARLPQASHAAATTLLKIMVDTSAPASCRLRAAEAVLTMGARAIQMEDLELRLAQVERTVADSSKPDS
jgi:transposase-like protein